jgi:hypothetical protein
MTRMTNAERKIAASQKQLKQAEREAKKNHELAHALDTHDLQNKGGKPIPVVGGKHPLRHDTLYQAKMNRNETESAGTKSLKHNSIFAKEIKRNPALFDDAFKTKGVPMFYPRSGAAKAAGKALMAKTLATAGKPSVPDAPNPQPFSERKIRESKRKD